MNTIHCKCSGAHPLVDASDVVTGESSEEAVSRVGADEPAIVALFQDVNQVALAQLQLV